MWRFLVVEDEPDFVAAFRKAVADPLATRAEFEFAGDLASATRSLEQARPDHLFLDIAFPLEPGGRVDPSAGFRMLASLPSVAPGLPVTVLSGQERKQAVDLLLSRKVDGYLFKDFGFDEVRVRAEQILEHLELRRSHRLLKEGASRHTVSPVVGEAPAMKQLMHRAQQVAGRDTAVLVTGESGTGKEVMARFLHQSSPRAEGPFVAISCGALPEGLVEAELFGAVKGAYTGLDRDREGAMGQARGGTLFLDEVGELPLKLQPTLLRALQEKTYRPLGGSREQSADFRLICATHRDLQQQVEEGEFREDLFFRIRVFPLELPPLRERREDLAALVDHMVERFNREMGRRLEGVEPEAMELLAGHPWPGNVRELANVLEYAFVVEGGDRIQAASLPVLGQARDRFDGIDVSAGYKQAMASFEQAYLEQALAAQGFNVGKTAEAVGIPRRTLEDRLGRFGIKVRGRKQKRPGR